MKVDRLASQNDIGGSILKQLNLNAEEFKWSRNLFNPTTQEFAFFEATDGVGWITPNGYYTYLNPNNKFYRMQIPEKMRDSIITDGKAYLQVLFHVFQFFAPPLILLLSNSSSLKCQKHILFRP